MAIEQPQSTDSLTSPSHAFSHRVIANDSSAPEKSFIVSADGEVDVHSGKLSLGNVSALAVSSNTIEFPIEDGTVALQGLSATKVYYVADESSGAVTRKLTFTNGILTSEI